MHYGSARLGMLLFQNILIAHLLCLVDCEVERDGDDKIVDDSLKTLMRTSVSFAHTLFFVGCAL